MVATDERAKDQLTAAGGLDLRIWVRLLDCAKIIEKRLRRNFEEQFGTTLPRFDVLASLSRAPHGLRMGELSRALLVSNGNVTAVVRQLQDHGLVTVQPDPDDRRSAIVALTPEGTDQFRALAQAHHGWVREALADFPEDRQRILLELLTQLKTSII
ncbi:MarR family winged helix-turn-helix transcriptional regulator [Novosphingobium sp. Leaf2]|uniref:MarR family winged helix-turn-helix transcriptional regulator n=1 Tax=Novosphingobium sp. Leaf2 TaxID=1735670 RepID=UPI0006F6B898|nr:MarR family transcriptional regulator [Novosphingobium sp. Leaf2]KQM18354.1 MarR family transcriptional regulator [Novosphingobium sp. Leaf2]